MLGERDGHKSGMNKSIAVEIARYTATDAIVGTPGDAGSHPSAVGSSHGHFLKR